MQRWNKKEMWWWKQKDAVNKMGTFLVASFVIGVVVVPVLRLDVVAFEV